MDKDAFETKLREVRKQKSQVEEELESVSERWRAERRRLNSEIDRLEAALVDAKDVRRKAPEARPGGIDPVDVAKTQAAADERIKKAERDFETERGKLRTEISRLQRAVAEQIERSNNPMRSTEPIKEQFQAQLDEAFKAKQQVEEELYRARLSWEEEKLKMTGEIFKLRRNAPAAPKAIKGKLDDEDRARELEKRLEETSRSREALEKELALLQRKLAETRDAVSADVVDQLRRQYDDKLHEIIQQKTQLTEELRKASSILEEERARFAAAAAALKALPADGGGVNKEALSAEAARVETMISAIARMIDDPATELSTVIRKNVERAELDAYLKGILFSMGRNRGL